MTIRLDPSSPSRRSVLLMLAAASAAPACTRSAPAEASALTVFAAASLQEVVDAVGADHMAQTGVAVRAVYAGSSQLARQIEQGAPADVFISADEVWMDWLAQRRLIETADRRTIAGNRLVLVAPADGAVQPLDLTPDAGLHSRVLARLGDGRLAVAEPEVPAGRYGREALMTLDLWDTLSTRLAAAENVRAALALVARGEAPLGVVYATDALAEPRVQVVATFDAGSHTPIRYPAAPVRRHDANLGGARTFLERLAGPEGQARLRQYGFTPPP